MNINNKRSKYEKYLMSATLTLPKRFSAFAGKTLSLQQVNTICAYDCNVDEDDEDVFDTDNFVGICILSVSSVVNNRRVFQNSIFALPRDLQDGPEFYINTDTDTNEKALELKQIMIKYIQDHPDKGLKIENFR